MMKLLGDSYGEVTQAAVTVLRTGFETEIPLKPYAAYARAAALDMDGKVLGLTDIIQLDIEKLPTNQNASRSSGEASP
jgi:hypothetical protein